MQPVILHIHTLGPIKEAEIEINLMTLLTGESGLGKSYVSMAIYHFLNSLDQRLNEFLAPKMKGWNIQEGQTYQLTTSLDEIRLWIERSASQRIGYLIGYEEFQCDITYSLPEMKNVSEIAISFTPRAQDDLNSQVMYEIQINGEHYLQKGYLFRSVDAIENALAIYLSLLLDTNVAKTLLFPPSRSAFAGLNFDIQRQIASIGMYNEFIRDWDLLNHLPEDATNGDLRFFQSMMAKILDGRLTNRAGKTYLQLADNQEVPLTAAASSVKELAPFMQALKNHSLKHFSILFEEPEAHVHPIKQQTLADVIACCMNKGTMFQITTHSDYLLSRFNQLIRLGNLKKKNEEAFKTYCQTYQYAESLFLDGSHINAYYFQRAGKNVQIKRLDTTNGIPFDTFGKAIDRQVEEDDRLENFLNEINHEHYK